MRFVRWIAPVLAAAGCGLLTPASGGEDALVGTKAPPWHLTDWVNSRPLTLPDLAGQVVLVRWWD
jgi:hypothetical protein